MSDRTPQRLWNRNFVTYWSSIALTALGDAFVLVALPFLVLQITGSESALATVVLISTLPRFLGPLTGALADRLHLRIPFLASSLLRAALFATIASLALGGSLPVWLIYVAAPLNALLTSFTAAAGMVLIPNIVPREMLARANSLMQGALMGVPLLGLGVAGALVGLVGVGTTILLASPCLLALAVASLLIDFPRVRGDGTKLNVIADMSVALRFLAVSGPLAFLLFMSLFLNASLSFLNVTMPVTMERIGLGARGYGIFESVLSAGLLLGILAVSFIAGKLAPRTLVGLAQLLTATGFAVFAFGGFPAYLAGAILIGLGLGASEVAAVTLLQLAVPDGMRGKVLGVVFTVNALGLSLGAWVSGLVIESMRVAPLFVAAGALLAVLALAWLVLQARGRKALDRLIEMGSSGAAA